MTATEADHGLWIRRTHTAPDGATRLICLPHAGGSASFYFPISQRLSNRFDVVAVQYPGRQDRRMEPCIDDIGELAAAVFEQLRPLTDRPLALFGHSMGATLGFEVARLLEQEAGVVPTHLFASGRRAPSCHRDETVHLLGDEGLLADVRALSGTDARVLGDEEILRMALPAIRGDYKAAETYRYRPGPPLSCPITAFTGDDDPKATIAEVKSWAEHTTAAFDLQVFDGGHFFLANHQAAILRAISEALLPTT
ncbi:thioesterase II family protein [Kitasatospora kifunensis]|uniref:Surfactin synthase thioesterase subunit n=1 Tax=Kitasatospora kifunensis TaxID=58351 RepID=A0A7W7QXA6_KITKI|nr:alpha/beta fold hydrolase [Kitasatospora kifunensis]MBB4921414.1 surfactin synthase thioesterase subunit [Kitasatospora kifunensis]